MVVVRYVVIGASVIGRCSAGVVGNGARWWSRDGVSRWFCRRSPVLSGLARDLDARQQPLAGGIMRPLRAAIACVMRVRLARVVGERRREYVDAGVEVVGGLAPVATVGCVNTGPRFAALPCRGGQ